MWLQRFLIQVVLCLAILLPLALPNVTTAESPHHRAHPVVLHPGRAPGYQNAPGMLPQGRRYYNGRYFGNFNNRYYGPQYGYF